MIRALLLLSLALSFGCGSGRFSYDELPKQPVALAVRSESDAKRFEEFMKQYAEREAEDRPSLPTDDPLERAESFLERMLHGERSRALFTHLVFLDPVERETERVQFAAKSTRPVAWDQARGRLMFSAERGGRAQLYEWIEASGEVRQLTFGRPHFDGCYGPDGRIAAVRHSALRLVDDRVVGGLQIFVSEPGGADWVALTDGPFDTAPTWSPDGKALIHEHRDANGMESLRRIEFGTATEPRTVARGRSPVFTPDGDWVVYSAATRGGLKLWKMHPDGTGRRSLGRSGLQELDPSVSPDGRFVVYVGFNPGSESGPQLMVKRIEGSNPRSISIEGTGLLPTW